MKKKQVVRFTAFVNDDGKNETNPVRAGNTSEMAITTKGIYPNKDAQSSYSQDTTGKVYGWSDS